MREQVAARALLREVCRAGVVNPMQPSDVLLGDVVVGSRVRLECQFTRAAEPKDPTTVLLKVRNPQGQLTTYTYGSDVELVRDGSGAYHLDQAMSIAGTWRYRWEGTGVVVAAFDGQQGVIASRVA